MHSDATSQRKLGKVSDFFTFQMLQTSPNYFISLKSLLDSRDVPVMCSFAQATKLPSTDLVASAHKQRRSAVYSHKMS